MILNRFGILLNLVIMIWQQMQSGLLQSAQLPFFTHGVSIPNLCVLIGAASHNF